MKKALTLFMVIACIMVGIVMYFYWNQTTEISTKGVMVSADIEVESAI